MNTHLMGAGDPGAKAARDARRQAVKARREQERRQAEKDSKTTQK